MNLEEKVDKIIKKMAEFNITYNVTDKETGYTREVKTHPLKINID